MNKSIHDYPDLMTLSEVADILRVAPLTVKRWERQGKIPCIRITRRGDRRFYRDVIIKLFGL